MLKSPFATPSTFVTSLILCGAQDYRNIQEGRYNLPWDMTTPRHRQFNPLYIARKFVDFVQEASATLQRRSTGNPEDVWLRSDMYPDYYLNTFHYQVHYISPFFVLLAHHVRVAPVTEHNTEFCTCLDFVRLCLFAKNRLCSCLLP